MDWALLSFPWVWLPPLQMSAKGPGSRLHEIQLCRECVHKSYGNRQSTACIGHCAVCCLLLINFFFFSFLFQYSTCASFCLCLVFVCFFPSYILFVNTLKYGSSFCSISVGFSKITCCSIWHTYKTAEISTSTVSSKHSFWPYMLGNHWKLSLCLLVSVLTCITQASKVGLKQLKGV